MKRGAWHRWLYCRIHGHNWHFAHAHRKWLTCSYCYEMRTPEPWETSSD